MKLRIPLPKNGIAAIFMVGLILTLVGILLVSAGFYFFGFADQVAFEQAASLDKVGFWYGLWHGVIAVVALICSLFSDDVAVYAIYNNGAWYNFGFLLGMTSVVLARVTVSSSD